MKKINLVYTLLYSIIFLGSCTQCMENNSIPAEKRLFYTSFGNSASWDDQSLATYYSKSNIEQSICKITYNLPVINQLTADSPNPQKQSPANPPISIDPKLLHIPHFCCDIDCTYHVAEQLPTIQQNIPIETYDNSLTQSSNDSRLNHEQEDEEEDLEEKNSSDVENSSDLSESSSAKSDELDSCPISPCQFSHDNYQKMLKHLIKNHKQYVCRYQGCNEFFEYLTQRRKHEADDHPDNQQSTYSLLQDINDDATYSCNTNGCQARNREFSRQELLEHLEANHADRPAVCDFCLFSYEKLGACRRHVKIKHIGQQIPCRYPECNKISPSHPGRNNHEKKDHGCLYTRINQ